jgi:hypothetical protein
MQNTASALQSVTLNWQPSDADGVVGYNVYYGTESGVYPHKITLGDVGAAPISGLQEGVTYYFVVTAYDADGGESDPSNEAIYTVPLSSSSGPVLNMRTIQAAAFPLAFTITTTGAAPPSWALEASPDLRTWHTVSLGTNSSPNITVLVTTSQSQFFRLNSSTPGVALAGLHVQDNGIPNSMYITTQGDPPPEWTLETAKGDLSQWTPVTSGINVPLNVVVIVATAPSMYFRLKSQ